MRYSHFDLCIFREKFAPFSAGFTAKLIPNKFKLDGSIWMTIETGHWCGQSADLVDLRGHGATRGNSPRRLGVGAIEGRCRVRKRVPTWRRARSWSFLYPMAGDGDGDGGGGRVEGRPAASA
jgi:hypothetical protein